MKRTFLTVIALAFALGAPTRALADDSPSDKDVEAAKQAYLEGKKLHDQGKLIDSIQKFKLSYQLSKNPLLLYNIGVTMEEAGMEDLALYYYRKFLAEAPPDAGQRATVTDRVKALEKKFGVAGGGGTPAASETKPDPKPGKTEVKPAGTYSASDFQHQLVDVAPPGKPLDVTAYVPEDSGFTVTLYFRTAGEGKFTSRTMKWRYKELVGRIPAPKMIGTAVQYYLEVKDQAGNVVTRSGKSTSPNQVLIEAGASPRFYPDVSDDGDADVSAADITARDTADDPLSNGKRRPSAVRDEDTTLTTPTEVGPPGSGFADVGSNKFTYVKWGATATAGAALGFGIFSMIQAGKFATALEDDAAKCGAPPCVQFDDYARGLETTGKRWQTFSKVGLGVGAGAAVIAAYYWYKELRAKKRGELKVSGKASTSDAATWVVVPSADRDYAGASAAVRF